MKHVSLKGIARTTGKKADVKSVRRQGLVPCNIYGQGIENISFSVDAKELALITNTPYSHIIDLEIEGQKHFAILHELQWHPITDAAMHVDFLKVAQDKPIAIDVPVSVTGHAEGVKLGGKLSVSVRKLRVSGLMDNLPDKIDIDVTSLSLGKQISAGDLHFDGYQIISPKSTLVCSVKATRASAAAAEETEE